MSNRISNEDLAHLIQKGESVSFEYKQELGTEIKEKLSTYFAAFANTEGGLFVLGINKLRKTVGYSLEDKDRDYISQQAQNCRPQVKIDIEEMNFDNNKIVIIYVYKSDNTIHTDKRARFPVRVGGNMDYLDITGLIPLVRSKLGLDYESIRPGILSQPSWLGSSEAKTKAKKEEIDLIIDSIKDDNKEVRLEGLRELELLIFKREISDKSEIHDLLENLFVDEYPKVRRSLLHFLALMIRLTKNKESKKKLIDRYDKHIMNIIEKDLDLEVRFEAINTLLEMNDARIIKPIIRIVINESDENYNRLSSSFGVLLVLDDELKLKFKSELFKELKKSGQPDNIKERIKNVLEIIRKTY
ncbi:MAG: Divergent AAA domain protein [Candidatus Methanoperedens nitroreducens]|uniref:Divergent AAA domain protein n=1 Tax=Candidatus Methanoperedens nitratireducens TaxID=1392998 RepID=A0A0P8AH82_9EURY|nr:MAG: Divergent AAA domain protein [Candidatus Methanoperedens sp. BLZ1]